MDAGSLDLGPVSLCGGVVQGERKPLGAGDDRLECLQGQESGDVVGILAGRGDGGIALAELAAELRGVNPGGDGAATSGQDGPEEQQGEPGGGAAVEGPGEPGEPLAWDGRRVRRCGIVSIRISSG